MLILRMLWLVPGLVSLGFNGFAQSPETVVLENADFRYLISSNATNVSFIDRASGSNYLRTTTASPCAFILQQGREHAATAATSVDGVLTLRFGTSGRTAIIKTEVLPSSMTFTVQSVEGGEVDALTFLNLPLTLKGKPDEPFGACAHSLNLFTRVDALPALQSELHASCEKKFGIVGAKVAIVGAPMRRMLAALQETLSRASQLPVCKVAGPWAHEVPFNHGSYLFNFGSLTETNVDNWIEMARSRGAVRRCSEDFGGAHPKTPANPPTARIRQVGLGPSDTF